MIEQFYIKTNETMKRTELFEYLIECLARDEWMPTLKQCGEKFWVSDVAIYNHFNHLRNERLLKKTARWKYILTDLARTNYLNYYYEKRIEYLEPFKTEYLFAEDCNKALEDWNEQLRKWVKELREQKLKHIWMIRELYNNTQGMAKELKFKKRLINFLAGMLWLSCVIIIGILFYVWKNYGL